MNGFFNRILNIDAGQQKVTEEALKEPIASGYLGGKGLATQLLLEKNPAGVDPLSEENHLVLAVGPATDSPIYGSCRHGIFSKSPLTGFYAESYSGGRLALQMSRTGCDAIVITGKSEAPVWLEISDEGVHFHDAAEIWGSETYAAEDWIKSNVGDSKAGVMTIGPGGENGVPFSVVENDYWRSAGRCGMGAVLGAKKIKGVAFHGQTRRPFADPDGLKAFAKETLMRFKDHAATNNYRRFGTPMLVALNNKAGSFPTRYWSQGRMPNWERISAETFIKDFAPKPKACATCFMACGKYIEIKEGPYAGLKLEGPEYETIYAFGGLCCIDRLEDIAHLNDVCDRLGLDTITAGNVAAFAIEAVRQGKLKASLEYGNTAQISKLLYQIAHREGIGDLLAEGVRAASVELGLEDMAVHVKGLEPAGYDPRALKGMGLAYSVSDRGACHLRATFYKPELAGIIPPEQIEGKADLFLDFEDRCTLFDTLIVCRFYRDFYLWDEFSKIIGMTTGMHLDENGLKDLAGRVTDAARNFNLREGLKKSDDYLPKRLLQESLEDGSRITVQELDRLLADYYRLRRWDRKNDDSVPGP